MNVLRKCIAFALILCMLLPMLACASDQENNNEEKTTGAGNVESSGEAPDPFAGTDYKGKEFRILTSTNAASVGMGNSNFMIEGTGQTGEDIVSNAVYQRNLDTEELLNVKLKFVRMDQTYDQVANDIKRMVDVGTDDYDLIINDLYPLAGLTYRGYFYNVADTGFENHIDLTKNYWYSDYMKDISLHEDYQFLMAGDYFADVLRSAHCLFYNKNLYENIYKDPDQLYNVVLNYEWTYDYWLKILDNSYRDLNGNSTKDADDRYGLLVMEMWGTMIPMIVSGDCRYYARDTETGYPTLTIYNERSIKLVDTLYSIYYSEGTSPCGGGGTTAIFKESDLLNAFMEGKGLFVGYQRLGSLENVRNSPISIGVIPYPMLEASDKKYITSSHDTTEIGAIPRTANPDNLPFITACIEVLCRESAKTVIPEYYETALKVKYASDANVAAMIDIIHDNFGNTFQLAYDTSLNSLFKNMFYETIHSKSNKFSSSATRSTKKAENALNKIIQTFEKDVVNKS